MNESAYCNRIGWLSVVREMLASEQPNPARRTTICCGTTKRALYHHRQRLSHLRPLIFAGRPRSRDVDTSRNDHHHHIRPPGSSPLIFPRGLSRYDATSLARRTSIRRGTTKLPRQDGRARARTRRTSWSLQRACTLVISSLRNEFNSFNLTGWPSTFRDILALEHPKLARRTTICCGTTKRLYGRYDSRARESSRDSAARYRSLDSDALRMAKRLCRYHRRRPSTLLPVSLTVAKRQPGRRSVVGRPNDLGTTMDDHRLSSPLPLALIFASKPSTA